MEKIYNNLKIVMHDEPTPHFEDGMYCGYPITTLHVLSYNKEIIYGWKDVISINYTLINTKRHYANYQKAILELLDEAGISIYNKMREMKAWNEANPHFKQYNIDNVDEWINQRENRTNCNITSTWARFNGTIRR